MIDLDRLASSTSIAEVARASVTAMGFNATTMNRGDVPAAIQQGIGVNLGIGTSPR